MPRRAVFFTVQPTNMILSTKQREISTLGNRYHTYDVRYTHFFSKWHIHSPRADSGPPAGRPGTLTGPGTSLGARQARLGRTEAAAEPLEAANGRSRTAAARAEIITIISSLLERLLAAAVLGGEVGGGADRGGGLLRHAGRPANALGDLLDGRAGACERRDARVSSGRRREGGRKRHVFELSRLLHTSGSALEPLLAAPG